MYRLVRIHNVRCGEYDSTEYALAPPDWDRPKICQLIADAKNELVNDAKEVKQAPLSGGYAPEYAKYPDKTVREVKEAFDKQRSEYEEWKTQNKHLTRSLADRLSERGLLPLWDDETDEKTGVCFVNLDWGHNHGLDLNYSKVTHEPDALG